MVLKFGGTSVADVLQIKKIALKVKGEVDQGNKVIVVGIFPNVDIFLSEGFQMRAFKY